MFSKLHDRLGTAGLVVAIVALVAALGGTAFAAAGLNGKQKKEVTKIAKQNAGKPGKNGAAGPQGPVGPAGPKGDPGAAGSDGAAGAAGGTGVTGAVGDTGAKGATGATGTSGSTGSTGSTGSPWTAGGTLPPGATETGTLSANLAAAGSAPLPVSFNIPLASTPTLVLVEKNVDKSASGCPKPENWMTAGVPEAAPGKFCVYEGQGPGTEFGTYALGVLAPTPVGAAASGVCPTAACGWKAVWAVTAPAAS